MATANTDIVQESDGSLSKQVRTLGSAGLPASLGQQTSANSTSVVLASDYTTSWGSSVTVTRPSDTATYGVNDVVGATAAAVTFANATGGAGEYMVTSVSFQRDVTALISGETSYVLHLYNVTPPSALADAATHDVPSGDRAAYLGAINLGTPVDLGSTLYVEQNGVNKQITALSTSLFGYLVTVGTYTATSAAVHRIAIHTVKV